MLDALIGLLLIGVLATVLAVTANRMSRANHRLDDARAATRAAERVLVSLQTGATPQPPPDDAATTVTRVQDQTGPRVWVRVDATVAGRSAVLYGLVPAAAADAAAKTQGEANP